MQVPTGGNYVAFCIKSYLTLHTDCVSNFVGDRFDVTSGIHAYTKKKDASRQTLSAEDDVSRREGQLLSSLWYASAINRIAKGP